MMWMLITFLLFLIVFLVGGVLSMTDVHEDEEEDCVIDYGALPKASEAIDYGSGVECLPTNADDDYCDSDSPTIEIPRPRETKQ